MPDRPIYSLTLRDPRGGETPLEPEPGGLLFALWRIRHTLGEEPVGTVGVVSCGPAVVARWQVQRDRDLAPLGDNPLATWPAEQLTAFDAMSEDLAERCSQIVCLGISLSTERP